MLRPIAPFVAIYLVLCAAAYCQAPDFLGYDTSGMRVTVGLDREVYLPGEVMKMTLTVSNPAAVQALSLVPFDGNSGCMRLYRKRGDAFQAVGGCSEGDGMPDTYDAATGRPRYAPTLPTTTFGAGETKRVALNSYDMTLQLGVLLIPGGAPAASGTYAIEYQYGSSAARAEFSVAETHLKAFTVVRLRDMMYSDHPPEVAASPLPLYAHVLAVRSGGVTYICVQQTGLSLRVLLATVADIRRGAGLDDPKVELPFAEPFVRVAESAVSAVSISAAVNEREDLTIIWRGSDGADHQVVYAASYPMRDRAEREEQRVLKYWQEHPKH